MLLSGVCSLNADAAELSDGKFLTSEECLSVFGNSIPFQYFNGQSYVESSFLYDSVDTISSAGSDFSLLGSSCLVYTATVPDLVANKEYITVDISPSYSIFNTTQIHTAILLSTGVRTSYANGGPSTVFQSPTWEWYIGGQRYLYGNDVSISGTWVTAKLKSVPVHFTYVPVDFESQATTSGYSVRAVFSGNKSYESKLYLAIACPYVSVDADAVSGTGQTGSSGSSGSDVNVNVEVDMSETNGLLGSLIDAVKGIASSILDGIKRLFVPTEEELSSFSEDMEALAQNHLGGLYQAVQLLADFFDGLKDVASKDSITIPACNIPLAGETLTLGPYDVPLKVSGMPAILYESIAFIIDFLATAAFINMCKRQLEIFLNPDSEVITDDS